MLSFRQVASCGPGIPAEPHNNTDSNQLLMITLNSTQLLHYRVVSLRGKQRHFEAFEPRMDTSCQSVPDGLGDELPPLPVLHPLHEPRGVSCGRSWTLPGPSNRPRWPAQRVASGGSYRSGWKLLACLRGFVWTSAVPGQHRNRQRQRLARLLRTG